MCEYGIDQMWNVVVTSRAQYGGGIQLFIMPKHFAISLDAVLTDTFDVIEIGTKMWKLIL